MRCQDQEIINFWAIKIPELENKFEIEYSKIKNDSDDYYKNQNNRVYSLLSQTIVEYFDNILRTQSDNKLKVFFEAYEEFYNIFKNQFVSEINTPNDLILDLLYVYIFEGIDDKNIEVAKSQMTRWILKEYEHWCES